MILKSRGQKYLQHAMKSQGFQDHCNPDLDAYTKIYRRAISRSIGQSIAEDEDCSCHRKSSLGPEGDIRDVISIGKLVRKNDGPEEVEQILGTMIKYGEVKEH